MEDLELRVRQVMTTVLQSDLTSVQEEGLRRQVPEWDSLKHVSLIFALEDEFDVVFAVEQLGALDSVSAIVEAVQASAG